jgi:predicted molibdopterin-dependent oxidoreductase YjgC
MNVNANHSLKPARRMDGNLSRGRHLEFSYNGLPVEAYEGETIATALIAAGHWVFQKAHKNAESRGVYCNIGVCHSCLIVVDGKRNVRACQTPVSAGCRVETQVYEERGSDETV